MSSDPYLPPGAPLGDRDDRKRGSSLWAVFLGVITDIGGSIAAGIVIMLLFGGAGAPVRGSDSSVPPAPGDGYLWLTLAVGLCFTGLGGHVAARVANNREYFHALWVGVASLVIGELVIAMGGDAYPLAHRMIGDLLVIPAALVGGHLRRKQKTQGRA
jgi:uncharacterized membrane protein